MAPDHQIELDDRMRGVERGFDVAKPLADRVGFAAMTGRVLARQFVGGQPDRQFLDLGGDEIGRVLGSIRVLGKNGGNRLADIAHPLPRQNRLQIGCQPRDIGLARADAPAQPHWRKIDDVAAGPYREDPRCGQGRGCIYGNDPAMRLGRAHNPHM